MIFVHLCRSLRSCDTLTVSSLLCEDGFNLCLMSDVSLLLVQYFCHFLFCWCYLYHDISATKTSVNLRPKIEFSKSATVCTTRAVAGEAQVFLK